MFDVSREELRRVLEDFYTLTRFKIVLFDRERRFVDSYPESMCRFCSEVRKCPELRAECLRSDKLGFDVCDETGKPYVYECFMSAIEAIAPIYAGSTVVGYLMIGQILGSDRERVLRRAEEISARYGVSLTEEMLSEMPSADEAYIRSAVNMMTMCAGYLCTSEILRNDPALLGTRIRSYVEENLAEDLSVESVARAFYISRTKLYRIASETFGMGLSDYVRSRRIERARRLLRTTDDSVSAVAQAVGIHDVNYFVRVFGREVGVTPLAYRKAR